MTKVEEQTSNDNDSSIRSNTSKESDIKNKLKKNHNKKKLSHSDDTNSEKAKKASISFWKAPCREILENLKNDQKALSFRAPAVKAFQNQRDKEYYKNSIKEPRDLGTITKKLNGDNYSPKEFYTDIELCWSNALKFNEDDTEVYSCALYLKEKADKLFKEKNIEEIIEKYNVEKENFNPNSDEKDGNMNDNTNNSNNNTNDSNNTGDKLNLNESGILENGTKEKNSEENDNVKKKGKERKDSVDSNSSAKSNKEDDSYEGSERKKHHHHHHKMTGKKRGRHRHKDKDKNKEKTKEENNDEEKKEKKRGRRRKKLENNDLLNLKKKKINFDDLKKKYPINYPVILSPEDIEKMSKKNGKKKIKKMVKLNNTSKNHDNHHKSDNHKKRGRNSNNNNNNNITVINNSNSVETLNKNKNVTYKFDWEFLENGNEKIVDQILIDNYEVERRKIENEQMANYDINCNSDNVQVSHKHRNTNTHNNNTNINSTTENTQKKKKSEASKNKNNSINSSNNTSIHYIDINNTDIEVNKNININNSSEIIQKSNNVSIDNSINEIKMITDMTNAVKIVDKGYEKSMGLRIEIARYFDTLTDSNMIDLLVYIENIRPQSIRILENDTIYIDMEAFNEDTFNKVFDYIKNIC